jgi:Helix-turn-helix domain
MLIYRANVYQLEPTADRAAALAQWVGACRAVYNLALEQRHVWSRPGRLLSYNQRQAEITHLRAEVDWLRSMASRRRCWSTRASPIAIAGSPKLATGLCMSTKRRRN